MIIHRNHGNTYVFCQNVPSNKKYFHLHKPSDTKSAIKMILLIIKKNVYQFIWIDPNLQWRFLK